MKTGHGGSLTIGIVLMLLAGFTFATLDSLGKQLMAVLPVVQVLWARYVVHTVFSTGYLASTTGRRFLLTRRPVLHLLRGMALLTASACVYAALAHVPIADVTAIVFFSPFVITLLSVIFLKERIGVHRIGALVCGMAGVILIIRPGFGDTGVYHFLALAGSVANAIYILLTRQLADPTEREAAQFHTTAVGALILTVVVVPAWVTPGLADAALLVLLGALATVGHFMLLRGFAHASASLLSPFLYGQVIFAALYSWFWFGDPLAPTMIAGTVLLVASGLYIWWRENRA
jgi:drug/metabolite transporter (DMT)-like permease